MNIGLINIEPKIVNTAYMQISQYHKSRGDTVRLFKACNKPAIYKQFDNVYCSSLFDFTEKSHIPESAICGGTGFDVNSRLSRVIEDCDYDYSLYPECDYSIVWFSRGCIRKCPFCLVHKKEGSIKPVKPKELNPKGTYIKIQDNNFFASPEWESAIDKLIEWNQPVDFSSGIDLRILKREHCDALKKIRLLVVHTAWDNPKDDLTNKLEMLKSYVLTNKIMVYVLIGFWSTPQEDLRRVETLRSMKLDMFAMPYNKHDRYQKDFARWVNHKAIFKTVKWKDYKKERVYAELF